MGLIMIIFRLSHHQKISSPLFAQKKNHPPFFTEAEVVCNGEVVMKVGGSQERYVVDIWSGNHPFFQGVTNTVVVDEGQLNRFQKRYSGLERLSALETMNRRKS